MYILLMVIFLGSIHSLSKAYWVQVLHRLAQIRVASIWSCFLRNYLLCLCLHY